MTWPWSANHAGPPHATMTEINTTVQDHLFSNCIHFWFSKGTITTSMGNNLWFLRFSRIHIHFATPSFATFSDLRIKNIKNRTHRYIVIDLINQHFNYNSSDSRSLILLRTLRSNGRKDLRSKSGSTSRLIEDEGNLL